MATYPTAFLSYSPSAPGADPTTFARDVSCIAVLGTGGCGFEQQLEAILKAVTPSTQPPVGEFDGVFNMGQPGHADTNNAGFVRPDSLLAIILVSDEEDCSARIPDLFNPGSGYFMGDLNLRCFSYAGDPMRPIHPVGRYVDGLLAQRNSPDLLVFAAIVGVPVDLIPAADVPVPYDAILADSRMLEMVDPAMPTRLAPSCDVPGRGQAFPPRRIVEVAKRLNDQGAAGIVQSICQSDFTPALDAIIDKIADVLGGACLPRMLNPDEEGRVDCDVIEVLPLAGDFTSCAAIPGRESIGIDPETGGEICRVIQTPAVGGTAPAGPGWYYDNFSADVLARCGDNPTDGQRISFTAGDEPRTGTLVRLECLQPVQATGGPTVADVYTPCTMGGAVCPQNGEVPGVTGSRCARDLVCDGTLREWQVPCGSDADCANAGLGAFRCDAARAAGAICVNPTCS
jgi:hypothetical protein